MSVICTLYEGDYHLGLGALLNSLHDSGFRGEVYAGFRGDTPPWSESRLQRNGDDSSFEFAVGCRVHFRPVSTTAHFNNYKPHFVLEVMAECRGEENFFFFDPDIVVKAPWNFFERWVTHGIAVCEDVNDYLPRHHPVRQAWKEYAQGGGLTIRQELDKFYNGGFFGLRREHESFLQSWKQLFVRREADGADLSQFFLFAFEYPYISLDQDLMNLALMLVSHPITATGPEGMGFRAGPCVMLHSAGDIKSWRKNFLWEAIKGRAPTSIDKEFVRYTQSPIKICSRSQLSRSQWSVRLGSAIGRFYGRKSV